ncbi:iron chelate uptake ABC transporter family permease subunit [Streptomyces nigrescens]
MVPSSSWSSHGRAKVRRYLSIGVAIALLFGTPGRKARPDDVVIGSVFSRLLGLGAFFITLYTTSRRTTNGHAGVSVLFGSIFGLSAGSASLAALIAAGICLLMLLIARPLLFAMLDEAVAAARGVPVRTLGFGFLVLTGICAAEATPAGGLLLLLGLLAAPAGAAARLTGRPYAALALSALLAVLDMWAGLAVSRVLPEGATQLRHHGRGHRRIRRHLPRPAADGPYASSFDHCCNRGMRSYDTMTAGTNLQATATQEISLLGRFTQQRATVLEALIEAEESEGFVRVQSLHTRLPVGGSPVGLSTVYRTLSALSEAGRADSYGTCTGSGSSATGPAPTTGTI